MGIRKIDAGPRKVPIRFSPPAHIETYAWMYRKSGLGLSADYGKCDLMVYALIYAHTKSDTARGMAFRVCEVADYLGCSPEVVRHCVDGLVEAGLVRERSVAGLAGHTRVLAINVSPMRRAQERVERTARERGYASAVTTTNLRQAVVA